MVDSRQGRVFFIAILVAALAVGALLLKPLAVAIIFGLFAALLSHPIHQRLTKRTGPRRAAGLTLAIIFLIIAVPLFLTGWLLYQELQGILAALQRQAGYQLMDALQVLVWPDRTAEERLAFSQETWGRVRPWVVAWLQSAARAAIITAGQVLLGVIIAFFVIYYILVDGSRFRAYATQLLPLPKDHVDYLFDETRHDLNAIFRGQILTSLIQGGLGGIGFAIAGIPSPVVWTLVMVVLSLLPLVGPFLVWIPAAAYLFITGHIGMGIFLTLWGALIVSQVDNFVRPKLIGARSGLHPLGVLLGVFGGIAAFGFIGLFLGPLIIGIIESMLRLWQSEYRTPQPT